MDTRTLLFRITGIFTILLISLDSNRMIFHDFCMEGWDSLDQNKMDPKSSRRILSQVGQMWSLREPLGKTRE